MHDARGTELARFRRVLGRRDALALAFGAIIGWSWVLLTGRWVLTGGAGGAMLAFVVGGVAMIFIGLVYAELAAALPRAGGEHVYSLRAFGPRLSFVCTWALLLAYVTVVAFEAVALGTALDYLVPQLRGPELWQVSGEPVYAGWTAIGVAVAVAMIVVNVIGVRPAAVFQASVTAVIIASGIVFATGALAAGDPAHLEPWFGPGATGWLAVLIMVPTIYVGFDVIPQAAEEIALPAREIGIVIVVSVVMAMIFYVAMILGVALAFPREALPGLALPTADAAAAAWNGHWAAVVMLAGGIAGILTSWNAFLVGASRVVWSLAEHGVVPRWLGDVHPRFRTPWKAVIAVGAFACVSPLAGRTILVWLIDAGSFALIIAYALVAASFLRLRRLEPALPRPFRAGAGEAIGWTALALATAIGLVYLPGSPAALVWPWEWGICLAWAALGAAFYAVSARCAPGAQPSSPG
jgi:amino acid transporter